MRPITFAINTNVNQLISPELPWRQRELAFVDAFQGNHEQILAVVDAATSERATAASKALAEKLRADPALFPSVQELSENPFFARNGLLFLPADEVADTVGGLAQSQPLLQVLVAEPSWRGLVQALDFSLQGVQAQKFTLDDMVRPLTMFAQPIEDVLAGQAGELLLAGAGEQEAPYPQRPAPLHRDQPGARLCARSSPARRPPTPSARRPPTCISIPSITPGCGLPAQSRSRTRNSAR